MSGGRAGPFRPRWGVRCDGEYRVTVESRDGELVIRDPGGRVVPAQGERPARVVDAVAWLRGSLGEGGGVISAESNAPGWDGQRIDHDLCVAAVFSAS
jgi:hypothetical protein